MSRFDIQYFELIQRIMREGDWNRGEKVSTKWKDGTPAYTKSVFFHTISIHPTEFPILTSKKMGIKTLNGEKDWIWIQRSNKVQDLRDKGIKIWNEWELEDGTIGESYGSQLAKPIIIGHPERGIKKQFDNQVHYVESELKHNKASRRIMTELHNVSDNHKMALPPCVHHTQWDSRNRYLNLLVKARSSDVGLGLPYNIAQYAILHRQMAQTTGHEVGMFHFVMGDVHIYDRHVEPLMEQMKREIHLPPLLYINPKVDRIDDFKSDDVKLINYNHSGELPMEIAIHG